MYTLTIGNRQLILDSDFSPSMLIKNPCWCFDEIPAPLCLDVTIPDNDVNRNILGFPGRFAKMAKSNDRKFPGAELRWGGFLSIYGTLVVTNASSDGYSAIIQSELRTLSDAQREKLIGDHNLLGELTFENKPNYDPATDLYCTIRLQNAGFWLDKGEMEPWTKVTKNGDGTTTSEETEREVLTRKFDSTVEYMVNFSTQSGVKTSAGENEVVVVSPYPFLSRLIELLLRENKLFLRNYYLDENEILKMLCLYNNISICKSEQVTQTIQTTLYDKFHVQTSYAGSVAYVYTVESQLWATDKLKLANLLPKMQLNELLLSTQNLTNTFFHLSGINDVDNIDREGLFDLEPFDLSKYRVSRWLPGTRQNLCLKFSFEHDSDDQEFNENFTDISSREDDIKEPVEVYAALADLAEVPEIGEIRLVKAEEMYYEYRQEVIDDNNVIMWAPFTIDIQDYLYNPTGDETKEIKTMFSTLRMHESGHPVAYQKGNSRQFSQFIENFTPRLLFYHGNNTGGSTATSGLAINWKSLVENRYRRTAAFLANALPVQADFRFPGNIFYKVLNEIYNPYLDREGSFFIDEMQISNNNDQYIDATLTVFKNEDNEFLKSSETVEGGGEHVVGAAFVPKFVGVTETGHPILVNAEGLTRPMPVFGALSDADYANFTCIDYSAEHKLLFVGGNSGQLHICDLSNMENIRYKTIQVLDTWNIAGVSIVDNGGLFNVIMISPAYSSACYVLPYRALFNDYASGQAVLLPAVFDHGTGHVRKFMYFNNYYYAITRDGEVFRTDSNFNIWNQLCDIDAEFIDICKTNSRIWVAEVNDDNVYAEISNPTQFIRFGLAGSIRQTIRAMQPLLADQLLFMCNDENACVWLLDGGISNANITPSAITNAGGACFDGVKYAYISVKDSAGYTKIARYNANLQPPETVWSYLNVSTFFTKLFLY